MLLVNKYGPKRIEDVLGNREIVDTLKSLGSSFPHLLLTGPPGTGKTTTGHILKSGFDTLELNASDERGIEAMRVRIKGFCQKTGDRKLVFLDECDSLTSAAQQALRRIMETTDARFVLACNDMSKLIEPIQSRCAILRLSRVAPSELESRVLEVCRAEGIEITGDGTRALVDLVDGDLRAALNALQALVGIDGPVDEDLILRINGVPPKKSLEAILSSLRSGNSAEAIRLFESLWMQKYEASDLMAGFFAVAKKLDSYEILSTIGRYQLRISDGIVSKLQFYAMFSEIS